MNIQARAPEARKSFNGVSRKPRKAKETKPFPIRFTEEELAILRQRAGSKPIGTYIRSEILGEKEQKRRILRQPKINEKELAAVLAGLGQSRMSSNLNQLAKAVNTGTLPVRSDVEQQLQEACAAVIAMRGALFMALGLRSGSE